MNFVVLGSSCIVALGRKKKNSVGTKQGRHHLHSLSGWEARAVVLRTLAAISRLLFPETLIGVGHCFFLRQHFADFTFLLCVLSSWLACLLPSLTGQSAFRCIYAGTGSSSEAPQWCSTAVSKSNSSFEPPHFPAAASTTCPPSAEMASSPFPCPSPIPI